MREEKILFSDCIKFFGVEESFLLSLEESGLIELVMLESNRFVLLDRVADLEQFTRWHYELDINMAGIEAIYHLKRRMESLQEKMKQVEEELHFYKSL